MAVDPEKKRAYDRKYYLKHRDKIKQRTKTYAEANAEQVKHRKKAYWQANNAALLAQKQQYREENRDRVNAQQRERYAENPTARLTSNRRWRANNAEDLKQYHKQYRRDHAEEKRTKDQIYREQNRDRLQATARERYQQGYREKRRSYRIARRSYTKEWMRQYRRENADLFTLYTATRRARKAAATRNDLTIAQWREIKAHHDQRCVYCGQEARPITMDHIIPLSKGGEHTASNVVPACRSCNAKKFTGPPLRPVQPILFTIAKAKKRRNS